MIVQTYMVGSEEVVYWDQANQVKQYRMHREDLKRDYPASSRAESFNGYHIIDNTDTRKDESNLAGAVRAVHWNDRITGQPYILFSDESTFILNDDGKTFVRV